MSRYVAITRMLLSGANVNAEDAYGETPCTMPSLATTFAVASLSFSCGSERERSYWVNSNSTGQNVRCWDCVGVTTTCVASAPQERWGGNAFPMDSMMDQDGFEYIRKIVTAGGFAAHAKAHRALVATLVQKFTRIPDGHSLVVDFSAHVGFLPIFKPKQRLLFAPRPHWLPKVAPPFARAIDHSNHHPDITTNCQPSRRNLSSYSSRCVPTSDDVGRVRVRRDELAADPGELRVLLAPAA